MFTCTAPKELEELPGIMAKPYFSSKKRINVSSSSSLYQTDTVSVTPIEVLSNDNLCSLLAYIVNVRVGTCEVNEVQFLVLECPFKSYLPSIVNHPLLSDCLFQPTLIVHITPKELFNSVSYQSWMSSFIGTQHLQLHSSVCPPESLLSYNWEILHTLNMINSNMYHIPFHSSSDDYRLCSSPSDNVIIGRNSLTFDLVKRNFDSMEPTNFIPKEAHRKFTTSELVTSHRLPPNDNKTHVTILGGGIGQTSDYRSTISILMHFPNGHYMLLDAGEGTLNQLYNRFGPSLADDILRKLKCIFVSHIHGDHSLGILSVIKRRQQLLSTDECGSILVIGPDILYKFLLEYGNHCESINFKYIKLSVKANASKKFKPPPTLAGVGLKSLTIVPVMHYNQSYGIVLEHKSGWKLVYSGDTRPSMELVSAGEGATLLIHESTFTHNMLKTAIKTNHSTDVEALTVAKDMKAGYMLLIHFGDNCLHKYSHMIEHLSRDVGVSFDFMTFSLDDLNKLQDTSSTVKHHLKKIFDRDK
jgi:ribonuclease Z